MRFEMRVGTTWYFLDPEYIPENVFNREKDVRLERDDGEADTLLLGDAFTVPLEIVFSGRKNFPTSAGAIGLRDWLRTSLPQVNRLRYGVRETEIIQASFEMRYVDTMQSVEVTLRFIPHLTSGLS